MTVMNAYEQLFAEGYLGGKPGSGTFVSSHLPEEFLQLPPQPNLQGAPKKVARKLELSDYADRLSKRSIAIHRNHGATELIPFQHGVTAIDQFPFDVWSKIVARHYKYPDRSDFGYGDPGGLQFLRQAVADHLRSARGVVCDAGQVMITNGAQQALSLISRVLLSSGERVGIEDPGYLGARDIFAAAGVEVVPVPVDGEGINIDLVPDNKDLRLIYVTPSHQFPLGGTLTLSRRLKLLEWARDHDAWIIEDDYDSEFRYAGRPLASLQGLDRDDRVIYVGTFGKTIFPALRLGCMVVPQDLVETFTSARALTDLHSSLIDQAVLAEFIAEGHFARHLRRMRKLYAERQEILIGEVGKHLAGTLEVSAADAGMHLIGWLPDRADDQAVSSRLSEQGLKAAPLSKYALKRRARGGLLLGYTAFDRRQIRAGVKVMKNVLEGGLRN
jgi:GntR family transcriptional regulator / MocR family aminotransferase